MPVVNWCQCLTASRLAMCACVCTCKYQTAVFNWMCVRRAFLWRTEKRIRNKFKKHKNKNPKTDVKNPNVWNAHTRTHNSIALIQIIQRQFNHIRYVYAIAGRHNSNDDHFLHIWFFDVFHSDLNGAMFAACIHCEWRNERRCVALLHL